MFSIKKNLFGILSMAALSSMVVSANEYDIFVTLFRTNPTLSDCSANVKLEVEAIVENAMDRATCGAYGGKKLFYQSELDFDPDRRALRGEVEEDQNHRHLGNCWDTCASGNKNNCVACCLQKCLYLGTPVYTTCMSTGNCANRFLLLEDEQFDDFEQEMRKLESLSNREKMQVECVKKLQKFAEDEESGNCLGDVSQIRCDVSILRSSDGADCGI